MDRFTGIIGIILILGIAYLLSNNKKQINYRLVVKGLLLQGLLAVFILKVPLGQAIFGKLGNAVSKLLEFSDRGADFVFGILVNKEKLEGVFGAGSSFIFMFKIYVYLVLKINLDQLKNCF